MKRFGQLCVIVGSIEVCRRAQRRSGHDDNGSGQNALLDITLFGYALITVLSLHIPISRLGFSKKMCFNIPPGGGERQTRGSEFEMVLQYLIGMKLPNTCPLLFFGLLLLDQRVRSPQRPICNPSENRSVEFIGPAKSSHLTKTLRIWDVCLLGFFFGRKVGGPGSGTITWGLSSSPIENHMLGADSPALQSCTGVSSVRTCEVMAP